MKKTSISEIIGQAIDNHGFSLSQTKTMAKADLRRLARTTHKIEHIGGGPAIVRFDGMAHLDVMNALPTSTHAGYPLYAEPGGNNINVWYRPQSIGRVMLRMTRYIALNEDFFENLGLSVGDATLNIGKRNTHYNFGNTNPELVKRITDWLNTRFGMPPDKLSFFIIKKGQDISFDRKVRGLFGRDIKSYCSARHGKPTLTVQLSSAIFIALHRAMFGRLKYFIKGSGTARRAFLRGLFAAEGHIKHSRYSTIESVQFAYNPWRERLLARFVRACLVAENVKAIDNGRGTLYVCGYPNMLKLYRSGIFRMHAEKEQKFIKLCSNAMFSIFLDGRALERLKRFSQLDIAKAIGCCQSAVSNWIAGEDGIRINFMSKVFPLLGPSRDALLNHIKYLKVTNSTVQKKPDISFLLSFHKFKQGNGKIKLNTKGKLGVTATQYFFLHHIAKCKKERGFISARAVSTCMSARMGTVQQRISDYVGRGWMRTGGYHYREGYHYRLTDSGLRQLRRLSGLYELA